MRSPYLIAFTNPLNLTMLGLTLAAGLCSAWWLLPVGLLAWLVMFFNVAQDPALRVAFKMQARTSALSPRFQTLYDQVARSQARLFNALATANAATRLTLQPIHDEVETLTDYVYEVCQRMTGPENYLKVTQASSDFTSQRALAVLALESTSDPLVKKEKQEALAALDDKMKAVQNVENLLSRVEAQVRTVASDIDAALADIMRLQAVGGQEAAKHVPALVQRLRRQLADLKTFEQEAARF